MDSPFVGQIQSFGFNFAPYGWALCDGQLIAVNNNQALFALIGTIYGGDGINTFGLPNLQSRVPVGQGQGAGLSNYVIGEFGGAETVTVLTSNLPIHTHVATFTPSGGGGGGTPLTATLNVVNASGNAITAGATSGSSYLAGSHGSATGNGIYATTGTLVPLNAGTITVSGGGSGGSGTVINQTAGGSLPTEILKPYLAVNYSIALEGIFPSRN